LKIKDKHALGCVPLGFLHASLLVMKQTSLAFLCMFLFAATTAASAQVVPSAERRGMSLTAGGMASVFQPDYGGGFVPSTSPNRLYGAGAFVDLKLNRWVQFEGEGRWLRFNEYQQIGQTNYLIGPRLPIHHFGRYTPYVKALIGFGYMTFENSADGQPTGRYTDIAYGGGLDIKLSKRLSARADAEFQQWPNWPYIPGVPSTTLMPYGVSVGVGYRIF
jgi:hypothetical protein